MNKKINWWKVAVAAFYTVIFGAFLITGEPMYLGDSFQHENQFVTREPVYALLIQILREITPLYFEKVLIVLQAILAIVCYTAFSFFLEKEYKLKKWMTIIAMLLLIFPHILTPIAASSNMVITNSIMTEGISYSLYLLFLMPTLKMCSEKKLWSKNILASIVLALILSLIRGQLMTLLIVWLIAVVIIALRQKAYKQIGIFFCCFVVCFVGRTYIVKTYNYLEQGLFVNTVSSKPMSLANVLYVCDREDGEAITDPELQEIFYIIYDEADQEELNYKYAPKGLLNRAKHHEKAHEALNFDCFNVNVREYIEKETGVTVAEYQKLMIEMDNVAAKFQSYLLPQVLPKYAYNYIAMISMGFVRSVAYVHPILNIYTILIYIFAIILLFIALKHDIESKSARLLSLTLLMIMGNVTATSFYLECISRYMIYNFPIFYIGLGLLILEILNKRKK